MEEEITGGGNQTEILEKWEQEGLEGIGEEIVGETTEKLGGVDMGEVIGEGIDQKGVGVMEETRGEGVGEETKWTVNRDLLVT